MKEQMKIVGVFDDRVIVDFNGVTAIAKYEDTGGDYFFNEKNEKQYVKDSQYAEVEEDKEVELTPHEILVASVHPNKKGRFTFEVTTANGWGEPNGCYDCTIKADTLDEAIEKLDRRYKNIMDSICTHAYDKYDNPIRLPWGRL